MAQEMLIPNLRRKDSAVDTMDLSRKSTRINRRDIKDGLDIKILGVSTGSALDELDCALVRYHQEAPNAPLHVEVLKFSSVPLDPTSRSLALNLLRDLPTKPFEIPRFNALVGGIFTKGIKSFCETHKIALASINLISTYTAALTRIRALNPANLDTQTFGWNAAITAETGITSVFDCAVIEGVRAVNGGVTARAHTSPVAFVDSLFLRHPTKFRVCLSIRDLANLGFIPPLVDGNARGTLARDCGPGNLLINYAMRYCTSNDHSKDTNGNYAASGNVNSEIVSRFLSGHDYLRVLPPLSIAQEMFGDHQAQRLIDECLYHNMSEADTLATITRITAENILNQYRRLLAFYFPSDQHVDELFISGPSARNSHLVDYLEASLPEGVVTKPLDDIGVPGDTNEAVCYAHLALEAVLGQVTRPAETATPPTLQPGAAIVHGRILRGSTWEDIAARVSRFSDGKQLQVTKDVRCAGNLETAIKGLGLR